MTLEHGLMRTWRLPRFSALLMLLRASARTFMRTIAAVRGETKQGFYRHRHHRQAPLTHCENTSSCASYARVLLALSRLVPQCPRQSVSSQNGIIYSRFFQTGDSRVTENVFQASVASGNGTSNVVL